MLTSNQKGAIAEAHVTAEASKLGMVVWRPAVEGCRYDMILDTGARLVRTQCKWARRSGDVTVVNIRTSRHTPGGDVTTTYTPEEVDGIAAWCDETRERYFVPIEDVAGQG